MGKAMTSQIGQRATLIWEASLLANEKLLLQYLNWRIGDNGRCWPSQADIAKTTGLSERTVRRTLATLRRKRILDTKQHPRFAVLYYEINTEILLALHQNGGQADLSNGHGGLCGGHGDLPGGHGDLHHRSQRPTEHFKNISSENISQNISPPGGQAERPSAGQPSAAGLASPAREQEETRILPCSNAELPSIRPIEAVSADERLAPHIKNQIIQLLVHHVEERIQGFFIKRSKQDLPWLAKRLETFLLKLRKTDDISPHDLMNAIESQEFACLNERSWGLLLSDNFALRFAKAIKVAHKERLRVEESNREARLRAIKLTRDPDPTVRLRAINSIADYESDKFWRHLLHVIESDPVDFNVLAALRMIAVRHTLIDTAGKQQIINACKTRQCQGIDDPQGDVDFTISLLA